ncbi:S66 peptidase family protein [Sanyastnella coralliicola]|uniref:S66 peptidase family protein n=1 Tax=Sanyastnella coralliicola TaxID=3069118 RepID=UPI0027BA9EAB|nr:LD-carboxypeptidase [Longitalea sp. SCSIO 12813]
MHVNPPFLNQGDTIALAAASRWCTPEQAAAVSQLIEARGFRVQVPDGLFERDGQLAGDDAHRAQLLNALMASDDVKAVLFMRGGYGAGRLLPFLRLTAERDRFPWLCGFSDVTAIHSWTTVNGISSLHSPVGTTLLTSPPEVVDAFFNELQGKTTGWNVEAEVVKEGKSEGKLIGGNLSVLYSLRGTPYFPDLSGKILIIEDLDEMLYHLDRMMNNFALSGEFEKLSGLLIGQFSDMRDNTKSFGFSSDNPFGYNQRQIIERFSQTLNIPVAFGLPFGHEAMNLPVRLGAEVELELKDHRCHIVYR